MIYFESNSPAAAARSMFAEEGDIYGYLIQEHKEQ